jgi:biofilm PGA synthesis N-glycosyltransferase PgaC
VLPAFSIVIPCFNEQARIGETLRLTLDYLAANAPESELIVVNDGSTDATGAIAREKLESARVVTRLLENFSESRKGRCGALWITRCPDARSDFFPTPIFPRRLRRCRS